MTAMAHPMDDLGLEQAHHCFGERVVVRISHTADRRLDAGLGEPLAVFDRDVLARWLVLAQIPAAIRFVSYEPALGELGGIDIIETVPNWIICGGESGPGFRPIDPDWARGVRDQCLAHKVAYFFKQWGGPKPKSGGKALDGREWCEFPNENLFQC